MSIVTPTSLIRPALPRPAAWPWERWVAAALIAASAFWHIAYLTQACPLDLAADEAHYWEWSRHLDWSYYSKGPLIAFVIRLGRALLGDLSVALVGDESLAVRVPAALCGAGLLVSLFVLARRTLQSERLALTAVALGLTLPAIAAGSTIMTIDAPYTLAWGWSLVLAHIAVFDQKRWAWPVLGVVVGVGILAKYTMLLFLPCLALFLLAHREHRRLLMRSGPWLAVAIAGACCLPIVYWNYTHDWVSLRHVGWQAGATATGIRWFGPVRFIAEQAGLLLIFWFNCYVAASWANRPGQPVSVHRSFLWWFSAPVFALFLTASLRTPGQVNWPIVAYHAGILLGLTWFAERIATAGPKEGVMLRTSAGLAVVVGLAMIWVLHYPASARPLFAALAAEPTKDEPVPMRRYDPTARLRGWKHLASAVDVVRNRVADERPLVAGSFWTLPGELSFYCDGHPEVYCFGAALGQRFSQFDIWRPNPLFDPEAFTGRTFIFVGDVSHEVRAAFAQVEPSERVTYTEAGRPVAYWDVTVCRGFRGFGPPSTWPGNPHY